MSDKSYVGLTYAICPATGKEFDTNEILLDKRMKKSLDTRNYIGMRFCPEVQEKLDDGYVVLVVIDESKSSGTKFEQVWRTGDMCYLKKDKADDMFDIDVKDMVYISEDLFDNLKKMSDEAEKTLNMALLRHSYLS